MSFKHRLSLPFTLIFLLACGGGGGTVATTYGTLTLKLGSDSVPNVSNAYVSLKTVEASQNGSNWTTVATVEKTYDLLAVQNGNAATLVADVPVATGTYTKFRLTWSSTTTYGDTSHTPGWLTNTSGNHQLTLPTYTTVSGSIPVTQGALTTAQIMFSGSQLIQYHASLSVPYVFQATGSVLDLASCATIKGQAAVGSTGISAAEVYAETVDGTATASIQRRALTDASGNFVLEALPIGKIYYIASQPGTSSLAYTAVSTTPVTATLASNYTANLAFSAGVTPGSLAMSLTPISTTAQGTWVELRQTLTVGSSTAKNLIVRSQTVDTQASQDQATFTGLASGAYDVMAQRYTSTTGTTTSYVGTEEGVVASSTTSDTLTCN